MPILTITDIHHPHPGERKSSPAYVYADEGYMDIRYNFTAREYEIDDFGVKQDVQESGYGKEFLYFAQQHARILGAIAVTASNIVSRESVLTFQSVGGPDTVDVTVLGTFEEEALNIQTKASARIPLTSPLSAESEKYHSMIVDSINLRPDIAHLNQTIVAISRELQDYDTKVDIVDPTLSNVGIARYNALYHQRRELIIRRNSLLDSL